MVERLIKDYPIATVCRVLDYPRSQVYYQAHPPPDDEDLKTLIVNLAGQSHLWVSTNHSSIEATRTSGQSQMSGSADGWVELNGQTRPQTHYQQYTSLQTLSQFGDEFGDRSSRPSLGVRYHLH
jgi:hypothetical protein